MTIEDLMKLRWKAIADYPHSGHNVGDIIHIDSLPLPRTGTEFYNKYPHLFKPLQWFEDRESHELPSFIKLKLNEGTIVFNIAYRNYLDKEFMKWKFGGNTIDKFLPATEQDYITYQSNQKL